MNFSLPRRLPDLDGDGVSELVSAVAVTLPSGVTDDRPHVRTNFVLVSGRQGTLIGRPWRVESCTDISSLNVTASLALNFDCISQIGRKSISNHPMVDAGVRSARLINCD